MTSLRKVLTFLAPGSFAFIMAGIFVGLEFVWGSLGLPSTSELAAKGEALYDRYGLFVVFLAAVIEGLFMVNFYFPGSVVIVLSVIIAPHTFAALAPIAFIVWLAFLLSGSINYWLGRYGFYRLLLILGHKSILDRTQVWMERRGDRAIFLAGIHQNLLAVMQVCMGIGQVGFPKTIWYSALSLGIWIPISTVVVAAIFSQALLDSPYFVFFVGFAFFLWGIYLCVADLYKKDVPIELP